MGLSVLSGRLIVFELWAHQRSGLAVATYIAVDVIRFGDFSALSKHHKGILPLLL
jgi:hypothetical protein